MTNNSTQSGLLILRARLVRAMVISLGKEIVITGNEKRWNGIAILIL